MVGHGELGNAARSEVEGLGEKARRVHLLRRGHNENQSVLWNAEVINAVMVPLRSPTYFVFCLFTRNLNQLDEGS